MATISPTAVSAPKPQGSVIKTYGTSASNSTDTLTTAVVPVGSTQRLLYVIVHYSAAPTMNGVTVEIDSNEGSTYDTTIATHTANGQNNYFIPDEETRLLPGDAIRVTAPAGGSGITAAIQIFMEKDGI